MKKPKPVQAKTETLSPDLLAVFLAAKSKMDIAQAAYNAIAEEIVQQYKLTGKDSIDLGSGIITREQK